MATQPDLGIENPYALDEEQFNAAIDLLKEQKRLLSGVLERLRRLRGQLPGGQPRCSARAGRSSPARSWRRAAARCDPSCRRGLHRVGRQLDDPRGRRAPELRVHVDQLHHLARGAGRADLHLRRGAGQPGRVRHRSPSTASSTTRRTRRTTTSSPTGPHPPRMPRRAHATWSARTTPSGRRRGLR
jgi:hypothetical protein